LFWGFTVQYNVEDFEDGTPPAPPSMADDEVGFDWWTLVLAAIGLTTVSCCFFCVGGWCRRKERELEEDGVVAATGSHSMLKTMKRVTTFYLFRTHRPGDRYQTEMANMDAGWSPADIELQVEGRAPSTTWKKTLTAVSTAVGMLNGVRKEALRRVQSRERPFQTHAVGSPGRRDRYARV